MWDDGLVDRITGAAKARLIAAAQYPTFENVPKYTSTSADEAIALGRKCGIEPIGYQEHVCQGTLGEIESGEWAAPEVALIESRQNGKGVVGEIRAIAGIALFEEDLIFWTAHLMPTALEAMQRILAGVTNYDPLRKEIKRIVNVNGQECIEFYGASKRSRITQPRRIRFSARTAHAGRGFTKAKTIVFDEAYQLKADQQSAIMPTMSTVKNTQVLYLSSPPLDTSAFGPKRPEDSTPGLILFKLRNRARAGDNLLAYYEWGIDENLDEIEARDPDTGGPVVDLDDVKLWHRTNPGYGLFLQERAVQSERAAMTDRGFARERLGAWPVEPIDPKSIEARVVNPKVWQKGRVSELVPGDTIVFGVDASPSRRGASIMAFWVAPDGSECAELVEYREGVAWLPQRLLELKEKHNPLAVAFDSKSQVGTLVGDFRSLGFRDPLPEPMFGDMYIAALSDVVAATSGLLESIKGGWIRHLGQLELTLAVSSVKLRDVGEGQQAFSRKSSASDISPIVALSIARQAWRERHGIVKEYDPSGAIW